MTDKPAVEMEEESAKTFLLIAPDIKCNDD